MNSVFHRREIFHIVGGNSVRLSDLDSHALIRRDRLIDRNVSEVQQIVTVGERWDLKRVRIGHFEVIENLIPFLTWTIFVVNSTVRRDHLTNRFTNENTAPDGVEVVLRRVIILIDQECFTRQIMIRCSILREIPP